VNVVIGCPLWISGIHFTACLWALVDWQCPVTFGYVHLGFVMVGLVTFD
jgi:hypothetical protein